MKDAQLKIREIVKSYEELFPDEAKGVFDIVKQKRQNMRTKHGAIKGNDFMHRPIHEISETLAVILTRQLTEEQFNWFGTREGGRWFAKTFKRYSLVENI